MSRRSRAGGMSAAAFGATFSNPVRVARTRPLYRLAFADGSYSTPSANVNLVSGDKFDARAEGRACHIEIDLGAGWRRRDVSDAVEGL